MARRRANRQAAPFSRGVPKEPGIASAFTSRVAAGVHAVHRAARQAQPTYDALCAQVRGSPVVTPGETGWKVGGPVAVAR